MTVYAIVNQKGGVGKTTTAVNLGAALREMGRQVLVVDLDPQGNATLHCGLNPDKQGKTIWSALSASLRMNGVGVTSREGADLIDFDIDLEPGGESRPSLEECILSAGEDGFDLVPSNLELSQADADLMSAINRERRLHRLLESIRDRYDFFDRLSALFGTFDHQRPGRSRLCPCPPPGGLPGYEGSQHPF
jgi:chromosome partitioning protein